MILWIAVMTAILPRRAAAAARRDGICSGPSQSRHSALRSRDGRPGAVPRWAPDREGSAGCARSRPGLSLGESPADAADGLHHRLGASLLKFLAQAVRVAVDRARGPGGVRVVAPYLAGQLRAGERLARLARQRLQQVELQPGQLHRPVLDLGGARVAIDYEAADSDDLAALPGAGTAGERFQAG